MKATVDNFDNSGLLGTNAHSLSDTSPLQPDYSLLSGCSISVVVFDQKNLTYQDLCFYYSLFDHKNLIDLYHYSDCLFDQKNLTDPDS